MGPIESDFLSKERRRAIGFGDEYFYKGEWGPLEIFSPKGGGFSREKGEKKFKKGGEARLKGGEEKKFQKGRGA